MIRCLNKLRRAKTGKRNTVVLPWVTTYRYPLLIQITQTRNTVQSRYLTLCLRMTYFISREWVLFLGSYLFIEMYQSCAQSFLPIAPMCLSTCRHSCWMASVLLSNMLADWMIGICSVQGVGKQVQTEHTIGGFSPRVWGGDYQPYFT